jgi:DNA-binding NarL/FixJ family response regulator
VAKTFLVIDDHPLVQRAIGETLHELEPDSAIHYVGKLADARRHLRENPGSVDLVLLDLQLPDSAGVESLTTLREHHPDSPVVVLSADADAPMIMRCLDLGAVGYIPKSMSNDAIRSALRLVASGVPYVPSQILSNEPGLRMRPEPAGTRSSDPRQLGLTDRQIDVLKLIMRGLPNKLICRQLGLAEGTVKVHVSAVLRALGARNRTQAVIAASRIGLKITD